MAEVVVGLVLVLAVATDIALTALVFRRTQPVRGAHDSLLTLISLLDVLITDLRETRDRLSEIEHGVADLKSRAIPATAAVYSRLPTPERSAAKEVTTQVLGTIERSIRERAAEQGMSITEDDVKKEAQRLYREYKAGFHS